MGLGTSSPQPGRQRATAVDMTREELLALLHARRQTNRDQFDRIVFAGLLEGKWAGSRVALEKADASEALGLLKTWVVQAPVGSSLADLRLALVRPHLRELVAALGGAPDHFTSDALGLKVGSPIGPVMRLPEWKRRKFALLADAMLIAPAELTEWQQHEPALATLFGILALADETVSPERAASLNALSDWVSQTAPARLPANLLSVLQHSAFAVSYLTADSKHRAKRAIVAQAMSMLEGVAQVGGAGLQAAPDGNKPRLTVIGELLLPNHAMFRCYAESLRGLCDRFHVTLVTDETTACPEHAPLAHATVYFPTRQQDVCALAQLVRDTRPDIVFYPSVGMCFWTFALSMLRLAPLQLASVGHPAPVCSPAIDGTVMYDRFNARPDEGYGHVYGFSRQALPQVPQHTSIAAVRGHSAEKTIAVIAASNKLNPAFLQAVEDILSQSPARTRLKFFPNLEGAAHLQYEHELLARFPSACVVPSRDYRAYLAELSGCDLVLQSFPFGGTNTTMDALSAGLPMVCLDGDDIAAQVDPLLLREGGLAELCANSPAEYRNIALSLLRDDAFLGRMAELASRAPGRLSVAASRGSISMADAIVCAWNDLQAAAPLSP